MCRVMPGVKKRDHTAGARSAVFGSETLPVPLHKKASMHWPEFTTCLPVSPCTNPWPAHAEIQGSGSMQSLAEHTQVF